MTEETTPVWYEGADAEVIGFVQNKKWENPLQVVDAYRSLEKFQGVPAEQIVKLPKDDNPEEWGKVWGRLGRPESSDKYGEFKAAEGVNVDPNVIKVFDESFFKANMTKAQRDAVISQYTEYEKQITQKAQQDHELFMNSEMAKLKSEWGSKYEERLELARRVVRMGLPDGANKEEVLSKVEDALGPYESAKFFANLADKAGAIEDMMPKSDSPDHYGYTIEQAASDKRMLMESIKADPQRLQAYNKGIGPDYLKLQQLQKFISDNA